MLVAGAVAAAWLMWLKSPGGEVLTVTRPQGGTVQGEGIQCGTMGEQCTASSGRGATVELRALADAGFVFAGFTGDCAPAGRAVMSTSRTCGATFVKESAPPPVTSEQTLTVDRPEGGTIEGPGIACGTGGADCSLSLPANAEVRLTARADTGFTFGGFTGDCATGGVTAMSAPRRCGAVFTKTAARADSDTTAPRKTVTPAIQWWVLTVTKPAGGTILGDNIKCGTEGAECGSKFPAGYTVTLRHKAEAGYKFVEFTGDCKQAGQTLMNAARTCGATFVKEAAAAPAGPVTLTVKRPTDGTIVGNGIDCGPQTTLCSSTQPNGVSVRLLARPRPGFVFKGFTEDCEAGGVAVMTASRSCGAVFAKADAALQADAFPVLTVNKPKNATIVGPGIQCGRGGSRCTAPQPAGSTVHLTIRPDRGYFFVRFTGDCDAGGTTVMKGPRLCAASVLSLQENGPPPPGDYPTLSITRPSGGTIIGNGIECGTAADACSAPQPVGSSVQLLARPDPGFAFVRFTGDCDAGGATAMTGPKTCGATFSKGGTPPPLIRP